MSERDASRIYRLRWWTLLVLCLTVVVLVLNTSMLNVALPTIQSDLGATGTQLQWMVNVYMMVAGALVLTCGALSDRLGRARFLQAGLAVFCLANLGAALSTSATLLIVARVFTGVGSAMTLPCTLSITTNVFSAEERGKAIGVWAGVSGFGVALGPIIGGTIVENLDWEWIFIFNIIVAMVALLLGWFLVPDSRDPHPRGLDPPGNLLFLAGIASLIYGLNNAGSDGWTDTIVLGAIIGSLVVLTLFVLWELRTPEPLLDMDFFKSVGFSSSLTAMILFMIGFYGFQYLLIFYLQPVRGYTPVEAGERCIPLAVGMLAGAMLANWLVARLGTKRVMSLGFCGAAFTFVFISTLETDSPFSQLGVELFLLGCFGGFITASTNNMLMGSLPVAKAGISSSMSNVVTYVGASIGVATAGSLLSTIYSNRFMDAAESIQGISIELMDKASDSIGAALGIAKSGQIPSDLVGSFIGAARESFMDGWQVVIIILCAVFAVGAAICLRFVPHRPGENTDMAITKAESSEAI